MIKKGNVDRFIKFVWICDRKSERFREKNCGNEKLFRFQVKVCELSLSSFVKVVVFVVFHRKSERFREKKLWKREIISF